MRKLAIATLVAAGFAAVPALAQQRMPLEHWYIGAGLGTGNLNISGTDLTGLNNASVDKSDTTYTVRTGWRFHPYMALELGYYDLGSYAFHGSGTVAVDGTARAKSVGLSFVGIMPIDAFDLYARIGYARSELKVNAGSPLVPTTSNSKDKQNEATYGVGARWNVGRSGECSSNG